MNTYTYFEYVYIYWKKITVGYTEYEYFKTLTHMPFVCVTDIFTFT